MEWRCEWCGKPHDEDDPPCDNCGHGSFERAVVRRTDLGGGDPDTTTVWVCTACGREHTKHAPPCSRCNNADLERREKRVDESNLTDRPGSGAGGRIEAEETTVWVCSACGRDHPKNAPPCSRCGHTTLERERRGVDADELVAPSYRDLVTPGYLATLLVVLALAALFVLGLAGVVDLPGFPDDSVPEVDAPGDGTAAGDISFADVEAAYLATLDERRAEAGANTLDRVDRLDDVAEYANRRSVNADAGDGDEATRSELADLLADECREFTVLSETRSPEADAETTGVAFADTVGLGVVAVDGLERTGVDVHSLDGTLYLTQIICR